jgi:hypothetical protein
MILSVSSGVRNDKTPWFKAIVSPQDSEGNLVAGFDDYIQPEDYATLFGKVPCAAECGYRFRVESNQKGYPVLGVKFGNFVNVQPMTFSAPTPGSNVVQGPENKAQKSA